MALGGLSLLFGEAGAAVANGLRNGAATEAEILQLDIAVRLEFGNGGAIVAAPRSASANSYGRLDRGAPWPGPHAGFDKRTTAGGIQGLLELAVRLVPDLARAAVESTWAGLRPGSRDGLPYLGRLGFTNLFVAAGHFRAGAQLFDLLCGFDEVERAIER